MSKIAHVSAGEALNSRGEWTLRADVESARGFVARAYLPIGRSRSPYEPAIPDLSGACRFISEDLPPLLVGKDIEDQESVDSTLQDLCREKPRFGNGLLPVSIAVARLAASELKIPLWKYLRRRILLDDSLPRMLPMPFVTLFMGGLLKYPFLNDRPQQAENIQVVQLALRAESIRETVEISRTVYERLTLKLISEGSYRGVGQDGGIAFYGQDEDMLCLALEETSSYLRTLPGEHPYGFALDAAAQHLHVDGDYQLVDRHLNSEEMLQYISDLLTRYPIWSVEDPFSIDDIGCWQKLRRSFPDVQIVGDDIFACNPDRIADGAQKGIANAFILKPDFAGTVSGMARVIEVARQNGISAVVSHRSGETCDTFVSDLACAIDPIGRFATAIRAGAPFCGERIAKWNRLFEIEREAEFECPLSLTLDI